MYFIDAILQISNLLRTSQMGRISIRSFLRYSLFSLLNLVTDIAEGKEAEGVGEHGVEENIWI